MIKVIKRYRNRRLYDPDNSCVITQTDLADMVRQGTEVRVIDTHSGEDVTLQILGRVMVSQTSSWKDISQSKEILSEIIAKGGDKSMSLLRNTVLASIGALQVTKAKAEKIIDDLIKKGELDKSDRKKAVMELLDKAEKSTAGFRKKVGEEASKAQKEVTKTIKDLRFAKESDLKKIDTKLNKLVKAVAKIEKKLDTL
ncbi:MAG: polyhydroxyalkanoate synthesis regulator DNA-binding domain-containing protein [bacterium]|nr:polyhydroxyalkanoate synthesis regulator DNA-binding domain-containing protein [bacterium]